MLSRAYMGLGSNLGDRVANIARGLELVGQHGKGLIASKLYETTPQGFTDQPPFLNAACGIWTGLGPFQLMHELASIEHSIGRGRTFINAPRTLDIDILIYGRLVLQTPILSIPHPRMMDREFVLRPLAEIAPDLVHPAFRRTIRTLLNELPKSNGVMLATTN